MFVGISKPAFLSFTISVSNEHLGQSEKNWFLTAIPIYPNLNVVGVIDYVFLIKSKAGVCFSFFFKAKI